MFLACAALITVIMFAGFARNYYLRAWIGTRPISLMVHVHGFVMTAWVSLFLTQALLVATRRTDIHRKLGVAGAVLAALVVALGIYTIAVAIERQQPGADAKTFAEMFVAFDGASLLLFFGLVLAALFNRRHPDTHRRLMLLAMVSLLPPAFGRLVAYFTHEHVFEIVLVLMGATVLSVVVADRLRNGRTHPALVYGAALVIGTNVATYLAQMWAP